LKLLQRGEFYKSADEEFIAQECPVEIRRVESVEITSVDCK
jgi:hypothetical protein